MINKKLKKKCKMGMILRGQSTGENVDKDKSVYQPYKWSYEFHGLKFGYH